MKRVMIYGGSGSGKSTLAQILGGITGLPIVPNDPIWQTVALNDLTGSFLRFGLPGIIGVATRET